MSRSRKKFAKIGICTGTNTEYYRDANRKLRNKNRHELRKLLSRYSIEEISEKIHNFSKFEEVGYDDWNEPTDGHRILTKNDKNYEIAIRK